jgi:hypothetical protein
MSIATLLLVIAFVLFLLAAFGVSSPRINLLALGLACWVLAILLGAIRIAS